MNESNGEMRAASLSERVRSLRLPDRPPRRLNVSAMLQWVVLACCAGGVAFIALRPAGASDEQLTAKIDEITQKQILAYVSKTKSTSTGATNNERQAAAGEITLESKGYVMPVHLILVSPKVGGTIVKFRLPDGTLVEEGAHVQEGTVLAEIEDTDYKADFDRAVGVRDAAMARAMELTKYRAREADQAQADLADAIFQRDQLLRDWQRNRSLQNANAIATKDYEQAESDYKSITARVKKLEITLEFMKEGGPRDAKIASIESEIRQTDADIVKAKWRLDNCLVRAPITGIILTKKAEEGNQVNPSAFSNGLSASLCEMADLTNLEVDLAIAERDVAKVFKDQKCVVRPEAFSGRTYQGTVSRIMPTADRAQGAIHVRVKIEIPREEEGIYVRPDMGALVTFYNSKS